MSSAATSRAARRRRSMASTGGGAAARCRGADGEQQRREREQSTAQRRCDVAASMRRGARAAAKAIYVFANEKGGMKDLDTDAIHRIILECSSDSAYTARQLRQDKKVDAAVAAKRALLNDDGRRRGAERVVAQRVGEFLRAASYNSRCFCVVDFDMFYAAVEIRDKPGLAQLPVAVGGIGMISTANYVARRWGVRSAMPGFVGQQLCRRGPEFGMPKAELVFVKPDFEKYTAVAEIARAIFREYDPRPRAGSLDERRSTSPPTCSGARASARTTSRASPRALVEAAVAATARRRRRFAGDGDGEEPATAWDDDAADGAAADGPVNRALAEEVVHEIRERVAAATGGLTSSAGIGHSRMAAKVAADIHKPNGQHCAGFSHDEVLAFLGPLSVRKLPGVGRVLEKELSEVLGVSTIAELRAELPRVFVAFSEGCADFLLRASHGGGGGAADDDADGDGGHQKGISCERHAADLRRRARAPRDQWRALRHARVPARRARPPRRRRDAQTEDGLLRSAHARVVASAAPSRRRRRCARGRSHCTSARQRTRARAPSAARGGGGVDGGRRRPRRAAAATDRRARGQACARRPRPTRPTAASENLAQSRRGRRGGRRRAGPRRRARARFDASEIDESVLAELADRGAARGARRDRRRPSAAAAAAARVPRRRQAPRRRAGAGGWAAGGEAPRRRRAAAALAAFVSGDGGANGGARAAARQARWRKRSVERANRRAGGRRALGKRRARSDGGRVPRESHDDALSRLLAMGFGRAAGEAALAAAGGDAQRAAEALRHVVGRGNHPDAAHSRYLANAFPCAFSWSSNRG